MIPIFDALTHPTLDGNWILPKWPDCASITDLKAQMQANDVSGAFAVGMEGIGGYKEDAFLQMIREKGEGKLFPVAFFTFNQSSKEGYEKRLLDIKEKGYIGIKLHPRIGHFTLDNPYLPFVSHTLLMTSLASSVMSISVNSLWQFPQLSHGSFRFSPKYSKI